MKHLFLVLIILPSMLCATDEYTRAKGYTHWSNNPVEEIKAALYSAEDELIDLKEYYKTLSTEEYERRAAFIQGQITAYRYSLTAILYPHRSSD